MDVWQDDALEGGRGCRRCMGEGEAPIRALRSSFWLGSLLALASVGCDGAPPVQDDAGQDAFVPDAPSIDGGGRCATPLSLLDPPSYVYVRTRHHLQAQGGMGPFRFSIVENASGGILDELTGEYQVGSGLDVVDRIQVQDEGCEASLELEVYIIAPLSAQPNPVSVRPGDSIPLQVAGGSGSYRFSLADSESGGTVTETGGEYAAGALEGSDRVLVQDAAAVDEQTEVLIEVSEGGGIQLPAARGFMPLGSVITWPVTGGSESYGFASSDETRLRVQESGALEALSEGSVEVSVEDRYTAQTRTFEIEILAATQASALRAGAPYSGYDASDFHPSRDPNLLAPGDINGDGYPDLIFGLGAASLNYSNSGALYIYAGQEGGLASDPTRAISGPQRAARAGSGIAVADFDGDGLSDLALGAQGEPLGNSLGSVLIYPGVAGAFFAEEASVVLEGFDPGGRFGRALEACDFNGDGWMDLAVSAPNDEMGEDNTQSGLIHLFLGSGDGFSALPNQEISVSTVDSSGLWTEGNNTELGTTMASGDLDGDGVCDLVTTTQRPWRASGNGYLNGGILVFRGNRSEGLRWGGLEALPWRAIAGGPVLLDEDVVHRNSYFGWSVAVGDLDGDELDDIVAGHPGWGNNSIDLTRAGALRVFLSRSRPAGDPSTFEFAMETEDWSTEGDAAFDSVGQSVDLADLDGDGVLEVIVGRAADEISGAPSNSGVVEVLSRESVEPFALRSLVSVGGLAGGDWMGWGVVAVGDLDADAGVDLAAYGLFSDHTGYAAGDPFFLGFRAATAEGEAVLAAPTLLNYPVYPDSAQLGADVAILGDLSGDGYPEALLGAPHYDYIHTSLSANDYGDLGGGLFYAGSASGLEAALPWLTQEGIELTVNRRDHRYGRAVSSAGDFDGDGHPDAVIVSWKAVRRSAGWLQSGTCASNSNYGSALVLRGSSEAAPAPAFVWYPSKGGEALGPRAVAGDFDFNGDGYDDLALGFEDARSFGDGRGAFRLVAGREADPGGQIIDLCDAPLLSVDFLYLDHRLGSAVAALGDLDADGCDDVAVGMAGYGDETEVLGGHGGVDVYFGFDAAVPTRCGPAGRQLRLSADRVLSGMGASLAAGEDVDGDGVADMVVGSGELALSGEFWGQVRVVRGAYLQSLAAGLAADERAFAPLAEPEMSGLGLRGSVSWRGFASAVTLIPGAGEGGRALIAVGSPEEGWGEAEVAGAVRVYQVSAGASGPEIEPVPLALVTGDNLGGGAELGRSVDGGWMGSTAGPFPALLVGAPFSSASSLDYGAAYLLNLSALRDDVMGSAE